MRKIFLAILVLSIVIVAGCSAKSPLAGQAVSVYKSMSCGCCGLYANYLNQKGLAVAVTNLDDPNTIKQQYNIPESVRSCHTTIIGEYVAEGHLPLEAIEKLMAERPAIKGIAMPGMPSGSPGMPGGKSGQFVVYALQNDGSVTEFMRI